jgi:hypothetical protein
MKAKLAILIFLISLVGCTSFKESVGQYVTDAVSQKVMTDVDGLLEKRGLSRTEIEDALDENNDGRLDRAEILASTKAATRDAVLFEAKNLVDGHLERTRANYVKNGDLNSVWHQLWLAILGCISAYLGKQVYSAKQDGKRDQRLAVIEKLLNRDIDGDGNIGAAPPETEEPPVTV